MAYVPGLLLSVFLLILPVAFVFSKAATEVWEQPLTGSQLIEEPDRHTPVHAFGTILPPSINNDLALSASDSPIIVPSTSEIAPDATLTLEKGAYVVVGEFGRIIVRGKLIVKGDTVQPITFTSNELHPLNKVWAGLVFESGSQGSIKFARLLHASPAFTCLEGSNVSIENSHLEALSLAGYIASPNCIISHSTLKSTRDGLVSNNLDVDITTVDLRAPRHRFQKITTP